MGSLALHEPATPVFCDTIDLTEAQVEEVEAAHPKVLVENAASVERPTPEKMAARKPFVLQGAMDRFPEAPFYALLDADSLIRRPLSGLWSYVEVYPAAMCITAGVENGLFYPQLVTPSGIVLVRRGARAMVDCWVKWHGYDRPLGPIEPRAWFWDQITLAEAWKESGIRCATIPFYEYSDDRLLPNSAIWTANVGDRKPRYYELFRRSWPGSGGRTRRKRGGR